MNWAKMRERYPRLPEDSSDWWQLEGGGWAHKTALIHGDCKIGDGCLITAECVLKAGCWIGDNCTLGAECWLEENCTLEAGCTLWQGCTLEAGCWLGQNSRLGKDSRLERGINLLLKYDIYYAGESKVRVGCKVDTVDFFRKDLPTNGVTRHGIPQNQVPLYLAYLDWIEDEFINKREK